MPEIDVELFQWATLGLLVLLVILLLLLYSALGQLRRALEQRIEGPQAGTRLEEPAEAVRPAIAQPTPAQSHPLETARHETPAARPTPTEAAPVEAQPVPAQVTAQQEPQEQPFERDGRWWFRRGDELLVYDERAGQWVPAPAPTAATSAQTAAAVGTATSAAPASEAGSFWKCPSCGAVNGSTATSCRMCFTARP
ncbi:MAG: hypothetical protein ACRDJJ_07500 [Actinomycetota bacterium]